MITITKIKPAGEALIDRNQLRWQLVALIGTLGVIVALTTLKAYFRIGYLWRPERQRVRVLELTPFDMIQNSQSTFAVVFETAGNIAFYIPLGMMLVVVLSHQYSGRKLLGLAALIGLGVSLSLECTQYIFALGRTDIDDLWCNTLGALLGASIAVACGKKWHRLWTALGLISIVIFLILAFIGHRLGNPAAIVE